MERDSWADSKFSISYQDLSQLLLAKAVGWWALSYSTGHVVPASQEAGRWVLAISFQIVITGEARTIENCRGI